MGWLETECLEMHTGKSRRPVRVVDADLKGYLDSIPRDKMMEAVAEHIADRPLLELIQRFLKQGVMESGKGWQPTEQGTPQGAVISPRWPTFT